MKVTVTFWEHASISPPKKHTPKPKMARKIFTKHTPEPRSKNHVAANPVPSVYGSTRPSPAAKTLHKMIGMQQPSIKDTDAAMSLCVLSGVSRDEHHVVSPTQMDMKYPQTLSHTFAAAIALPNIVEDEPAPVTANLLVQDSQANVSTISAYALNSSNAETTKASPAPPKKKSKRGTYNKHIHPVSFDEMKRIMRVYGPIKCLRQRNSSTHLKSHTKDTSIKRKFYRWFPDFNERFEMTEGGWFMPKYGHEEEMKYRKAMRKSDQQVLIKKRSLKRCGPKS